MKANEKASREVTIQSETGLHARPASQFVQKAAHFQSDIHIVKDGRAINAKSIMGVLAGGIAQGSTVTIEAEGPDALKAVDELVELVETNFGQED